MNGFIAIFSAEKEQDWSVEWKKLFDFQPTHINRKIYGVNTYIEQFTAEKFLPEKLWIETETFICVTDGVILNKERLKQQHNISDDTNLIAHLHQQSSTFFSLFEGNFMGLFIDKKSGTWTAFNNQTGTKKLFYYKGKDRVMIATDLAVMHNELKKRHIETHLDKTAVYLMLDAGFMIGDLTYVQEIKQVTAGEYLHWNIEKDDIGVKSYFHLQDIVENSDTAEEMIAQLDRRFSQAVRLEYEMDKKYNATHLSTLSAGLDSRMTTLIAHKEGFNQQDVINFSEKGFVDEVVAKQIAKHYHLHIQSFHFSPDALTNIDEVISVNDGLTLYTSTSHLFSILDKIPTKNYGIFHTGMLGDAILGSYLSTPYHIAPKLNDGKYVKNENYPISNTYIKSILTNFKSEEQYKFYTRGFLGINNGFLFYDLISESFAPFLNVDFLTYAQSIPCKYRHKERIYIDWIRQKHPDLAEFVWEAIGGKPTNNTISRFIYRWKRALIKRLPLKTMWKNNMNPEQLWYDNNPTIKEALDSYFHQNIAYITDSEIREDLLVHYQNRSIEEKAQALTVVGAIKLLFG